MTPQEESLGIAGEASASPAAERAAAALDAATEDYRDALDESRTPLPEPEPEPVAEAEPVPLRIVTLDEVLAADDLGEELVPVPEWGAGAQVKVRGLTHGEMHDCTESAKVNGIAEPRRMQVAVVIAGCVEPAFTEDHRGALEGRNFEVVLRLFNAILGASGWADSIEELEATFPGESD